MATGLGFPTRHAQSGWKAQGRAKVSGIRNMGIYITDDIHGDMIVLDYRWKSPYVYPVVVFIANSILIENDTGDDGVCPFPEDMHG